MYCLDAIRDLDVFRTIRLVIKTKRVIIFRQTGDYLFCADIVILLLFINFTMVNKQGVTAAS